MSLVALGQQLLRDGYRFVTTTPATHARVVAREAYADARSLRDIFGWSRPFRPGSLPAEMYAQLEASHALETLADGRLRSRVRFSTLGEDLFVHSAYPTDSADAVFFGPDTYRFARFVAANVPRGVRVALDVGAGSGAGGLSIRRRVESIILADVNPAALEACRVNAALAGASHTRVVESNLLGGVEGPLDLVMMNPPYLVDANHRTYRDGGGALGIDLAVRFVDEGLRRLERGGTLILYTASPIRDGRDPLLEALRPSLEGQAADFRYEELDPDVFGEELDGPAYRDVERLSVVGLVAHRA